jgi:hypothetical protein
MSLFDIEEVDVPVNPANIAYMIIVLLSATFDLTVYVVENPDADNEELIVVTDDAETVYFAVGVPAPFGTLFTSILEEMGGQVSGEEEEEEEENPGWGRPWVS